MIIYKLIVIVLSLVILQKKKIKQSGVVIVAHQMYKKCYPISHLMLAVCRNSIALWKVPKFGFLALLVRASCR